MAIEVMAMGVSFSVQRLLASDRGTAMRSRNTASRGMPAAKRGSVEGVCGKGAEALPQERKPSNCRSHGPGFARDGVGGTRCENGFQLCCLH
jgi:hypothetical protein